MIQKFSNRVLDGLGREYGVIGSVSRTDSLDIAPPVLVHDVSENVRATSWIPVAATLTAAGAALSEVFIVVTRAQFLETATVDGILDLLRLFPGEVDIWPFAAQASVTALTAADYESGAVGVRMAQSPGQTSVIVPLQAFLSPFPQGVLVSGAPQPIAPILPYFLPFLLSDHGPSAFLGVVRSGAGGGAVVQMNVHCYVGPKGSIPPGV